VVTVDARDGEIVLLLLLDVFDETIRLPFDDKSGRYDTDGYGIRDVVDTEIID
jgi:hypothetical protein